MSARSSANQRDRGGHRPPLQRIRRFEWVFQQATRWSWIAWALTTEPGLTHLVILIVNPCTSPSASGERTSVIPEYRRHTTLIDRGELDGILEGARERAGIGSRHLA